MRRALTTVAALGVAVLAALIAAPPAVAQPSDVTRLAIVGDSLTTGYGVAAGQGYADLLEADDPGDNVLPLAHDGWTVRRWLTVSLPELQQQLAAWQPTTVLVALGGNDWYNARRPGDYTLDLTYLIWHIRQQVPAARVILWHYYPLGVPQNAGVCDVWPCNPGASTWGQYGTAMVDAAVRNVTGYIDTSVRTPPWSSYYQPDRIHLTPAGHQALHTTIRARLLACC